jgi:hypothetical protein
VNAREWIGCGCLGWLAAVFWFAMILSAVKKGGH